MKTIQYILDHYNELKTFLEDRFGARLCEFLTIEQMDKIGFKCSDEEAKTHKPKEWTEQNVLAQLEQDVAFGFEKALNKRGISASLMHGVVKSWCIVLENGIDESDAANYPMYGLPLFKAVAVKYGFPNPIGDDTGREEVYDG